MLQVGKFNTLTVLYEKEQGLYLDGFEEGTILLPRREIPEGVRRGDRLSVFVYLDSNDYLIATLQRPLLQVGQFGVLLVAEVNQFGAFLDWGLPKQLLLPFAEQRRPLTAGQRVLVYGYLDNSGRLAASSKIERYVQEPPANLRPGQAVEWLVARRTDLGYMCLVNHQYWGLLQQQDLFRSMRVGQRCSGYIKRIPAPGKVDLMLEKPGYGKVEALADTVLAHLRANQGFSPLSDHSDPQQIQQSFGVSKKSYKMAIGALHKQGLIRIASDGIHLLTP